MLRAAAWLPWRALAAAIISMAAALPVHAADATLPVPADLRREAAEAAKTGQPLIILFSLPDCSFCHVVRQHYLVPILRDAPLVARPAIREIDLSSDKPLAGFDGRPSTQRLIARDMGIRFAPTVVFLDQSGKPLADSIVGGDTAGFYGAYLDQAIVQSQRMLALRASRSAR